MMWTRYCHDVCKLLLRDVCALLYVHAMVNYYMMQMRLVYGCLEFECCIVLLILIYSYYISPLCVNVVMTLVWFDVLHCHYANDLLQDICASFAMFGMIWYFTWLCLMLLLLMICWNSRLVLKHWYGLW